MPGEIVVGLDVGTTKTCAIVGEAGPGGSVELTGVGVTPCHGLKKGAVVDLVATTKSIRESVEKAARQAQVEIRTVTVGITGEHIASMNTRGNVSVEHPGDEISELDRDRALKQAKVILCPPDRQILHAEPSHYTVDGQNGIRQPVGMVGSRLEVEAHVVTGARSYVENIIKSVERAGLAVEEDGIVLESLAAAEAVLSPDEREMGVALVDIGGGTTDLAVFQKGSVCHSAVIPVGGWHMTHDLSVGLTVSEEEAERLKLEYGTALTENVPESEDVLVHRINSEEPTPLPRKVLAEILEARVEELFELIGKEIAEGCKGKPRAGLVITGGAAQLPGILVVADRVLKETEVRLGLPRCAGGVADSVAKPPYAAAVGLVMLAARRHEQVSQEDGHLLNPMNGWLKKVVRSVFKGDPRG
ncbi:MAG: cell division protein FtsA [Armatimonadetes bacterium]|nr:cell division protein FtsA [Armatimonadota bacterium]